MAEQLTFDLYRAEWLSDITTGNPSTTELGRRFSRKLLTQWLDLDESSDDVIYCDGAGDGGIDIAYLYRSDSDGDVSPQADIWYLIQSKYGTAFQGNTTLLRESQKVLETLDSPRRRLSSLADGLIEQLTSFKRAASEHDRIILVFATDAPLTNPQKKTLKDVRAMGRERLGPIFDVESISIQTIFDRSLEELSKWRQVSIPIFPEYQSTGDNLLVCSISVTSLYDFLTRYQEDTGDLDKLFEKNIRRFLGGRGKVNRAIAQTLKESPDLFGLYNNGLTMVVSNFYRTENGSLRLIDPYIVNGCQTTRTIWEVCRQRLGGGGTGNDPVRDAWKAKAQRGLVVTKIVKVGQDGEQMMKDITRYANSQNAVKEKDFLALDSDFKTWKTDMESKHAIYLEIQRGAWDSQKAWQRQHPSDHQYIDHANAFDLLKVYGAGWISEAGNAFGRNAAFLPNGSVFKRIVDNDELTFSVDDLYAAYRLQVGGEGFNFGRTGKTSRRLTRYLFYTVCIELLKGVMVRADISCYGPD